MKLYQDKAKSHISKSITAFLEKMKIDARNEDILLHHIPAKFTNVSLMIYCDFSLLKKGLPKHKPITVVGLWKVGEEK